MHAIGPDFPIVAPSISLLKSLVVMDRSNLGCVVGAEEGCVVGVFTDGDLRRSILDEAPLDLPVRDFMTVEPIYLEVGLALGQALDAMEQSGKKIYFAPLIDADGQLCGVLRIHYIVSE